MMKKITSILLVLCMAFSLAGCNAITIEGQMKIIGIMEILPMLLMGQNL